MATGDLVLGDKYRDNVSGTTDDDAILTGRGSDVIYNTDGDDYVDGGTGGSWWFWAWDTMIFNYNLVDQQSMAETGDEYYYKVYQLDHKTYIFDRFDSNGVRIESDLVRNVESFVFNNGKQYFWEIASNALAVEVVAATDTGSGYSAIATEDLLHYKLFASADNDSILQGNDGHDKLFGAAGNDMLHGGAGHDFLSGNAGDDVLFAGSGHDEIHAGAGNDVVHGEDGHDYLDGGLGDDVLSGGRGNDAIHAQSS